MRMLMNNLDPEVAEDPANLVVYGGSGKAARDWDSFRAIVTAKSRGDITFVGPFRSGKVEGPCKSFPIEAHDEVQGALVSFLETFLAEAATP